MNRRRTATALGALLLAGCAGLGVPRNITLSESELQAQLAKRAPGATIRPAFVLEADQERRTTTSVTRMPKPSP